nr:venom protein [Lampona murina]
MKIILLFSLFAIVFSANIQPEETDLEVVHNEVEGARFEYEGCYPYWTWCTSWCDCCGNYLGCFRNHCRYDYSDGFCQEKKDWCKGMFKDDYKCEY